MTTAPTIRFDIFIAGDLDQAKQALQAKAKTLADLLMVRLCQHSYSIVGLDETEWVSRRPDVSPASPQTRPVDRP